jgi:hypothetical protein
MKNRGSKTLALGVALIMSFGFWSSASADSFPKTIPLPTDFAPEGITVGDGPTAYVGSLWDGSIYEADLRTGAGGILVQGSLGELLAVGLDFDKRSKYLFVAGGLTGDGRVYDTMTGQLIDRIFFGGLFTNDVVVTRKAAYFTDSLVPRVYKVPLTSKGMPSSAFETLVLHGDWQDADPVPGEIVINANGIVATANGRTLIVVNYATGVLYNLNPNTGFATEIDLGGVEVPWGDGLVLNGKTLYVVQNFLNQIAVFRMSPDYLDATLTKVITDADFRIPATADLFGSWLYAVNARFDACPPGDCFPSGLDFDIVRVDK